MAITLSEALGSAMRRAGVGAKTLSKLTGVPRTAIDNWRDGVVRRPRRWQPLVKIARVLNLSGEEVDILLQAGGFPGAAELADCCEGGDPDRALLYPWLVPSASPARVRAATADFVGRADALATLVKALRTDVGRAAVVGVRGMGGVGKTELAVRAANLLYDTFPGAQIIVNLRGASSAPLSPAQALRQAVHAVRPDAQLDDDVEALQRRYCAILAGKRALVLADDASGAAQVRPLLPPTGSALLVTSRKRFSLPGMTTVDLVQLDEDDAMALIRGLCHRVRPDDARAVAKACGCLPLALRISGSVLHNDPALAVSDYVAALSDRRRRLAHLRDPDDAGLDVAASLGLSYAGLGEPARHVLRGLGVLAADFDTELATAAVEAPAGTSVADVLHDLVRRNLVAYDAVLSRWRLHDLVRDLAAGYLEEAGEWQAAMWRYAEACLDLAVQIQRLYASGGDSMVAALERFETVRPHLDEVRRWLAGQAGDERADRMLVAESTATYDLGYLRYDRRTELMPQALDARAAARRLGDRRSEAVMRNRLGRLALDLGDVSQAVEHFGDYLALMRSFGDPADVARAVNSLGVGYLQLGQPWRAVELNEEQLALGRSIGDRRVEARALCNLGNSFLLLGRAASALDRLRPALAITRDLGERPGEGVVLDNMGEAYLLAGDLEQCLQCLAQALSIAREMGNRQREAEVMVTLAKAEVVQGNVPEAIHYGVTALAIAREIGVHHAEARALQSLTRAYVAAGDLAQARASFDEALAALRAAGDRYGEADCCWRLGLLLLPYERDRAITLLRTGVAYKMEMGHADAAAHADFLADAQAGLEPADPSPAVAATEWSRRRRSSRSTRPRG
jgi:tetratricopeptide (TPR) repeat protein